MYNVPARGQSDAPADRSYDVRDAWVNGRGATLVYDPATQVAVARGAGRGRLVACAVLLGVGVFLALLLVVPGTINVLDGQSMVQVTRSIVERGDVTVSAPVYGVPGLHGHLYSKYGPGQSLAAVPLYLLGRALQPLVPAYYRPELPVLAASLLPALATALAAALLLLAAVELGASVGGALALALVYAAATPAAVYATQWFSEPLVACALLAAVYMVLRDRAAPALWRPLLAGAALALAVATRLDALLFAPPLLLYALVPPERRAARLAALALPLAVALAGLGLYNAARFGSPTQTGYSGGNVYDVRDTHPWHGLASLAEGLYGLLLSPGKGVVEYAPAVLLAPFGAAVLWARRRAEAALLLALVLIDLIAHANVLIRWVGGWSWGPRFLLPVLPLLLLLAAPLLRPGARYRRAAGRALAVLAALGLLVQAPALLVYQPTTYICALQPRYGIRCGATPPVAAMTRLEDDYINQPDLSPIVGSWRQLGNAATWAAPAGGALAVAPSLVARKSVTVAPHTWWRLLALQGVPAGRLIAVCVVLAALAVIFLLAALRLVLHIRDGEKRNFA